MTRTTPCMKCGKTMYVDSPEGVGHWCSDECAGVPKFTFVEWPPAILSRLRFGNTEVVTEAVARDVEEWYPGLTTTTPHSEGKVTIRRKT